MVNIYVDNIPVYFYIHIKIKIFRFVIRKLKRKKLVKIKMIYKIIINVT